MSFWDDIKNKGKEMATEAINGAIPTITEKLGEAINSVLKEKKEDEKSK